MTKVDVAKLIAHLNRKWGANRPCPMCGTHEWHVQEAIFQLPDFVPNSFSVGGPVIPVVPVICANCGNTVLVNAIGAGLVEPTEKPA
jgi:hypothetical protein